eukprot:12733657-Heterocapsa_arctica.AAC.1
MRLQACPVSLGVLGPASRRRPCGQHGHIHVRGAVHARCSSCAVWALRHSLRPRGHRRDAGPGWSTGGSR